MVMNPLIFIITYGLFFSYNMIYFFLIKDNNNLIKSVNLIQNEIEIDNNNKSFSYENTNLLNKTYYDNKLNNTLVNKSNNTNHNKLIIKKEKQNNNYYSNSYKTNCYISDIIIHYKC